MAKESIRLATPSSPSTCAPSSRPSDFRKRTLIASIFAPGIVPRVRIRVEVDLFEILWSPSWLSSFSLTPVWAIAPSKIPKIEVPCVPR